MKQTTLEIFGLPIFKGTAVEFSRLLSGCLKKQDGPTLVATPNPEQIVLASKSRKFYNTLKRFDWLTPDGIGLIKASCWLKRAGKVKACLKERITGVDLVSWLFEFATKHNLRVLVVGGKGLRDLEFKIKNEKFKIVGQRGVNRDRRWKMEDGRWEMGDGRRNIGRDKIAQVVYWIEGYKNKTRPTEAEEQGIISIITKLKPDIVLVALGAPEQERWLVDHRPLLEASGVKLGLTIGGAMDMLVGRVPRAPGWLQTIGLEWLWRLAQEPWRWRRQLRLFKFVWLVIRS